MRLKEIFGIMNDRKAHFYVCLIAAIAVGSMACFLGEIGSLLCGSLFALGLGLGKGYGDSKAPGGGWNRMDIVADVLGIALALFLIWLGWRD